MLAVQHQYPKCITKIDSLVHAVKLGVFLQYWLNKNGEGAGDMTPVNGGKENSCILFFIKMHYLPSARACGTKTLLQLNP